MRVYKIMKDSLLVSSYIKLRHDLKIITMRREY